MEDFRKLNCDFYDEQGQFRQRHLFRIIKRQTSKENLKLLWQLLNFIRNSNTLQRTGIAYIKNHEYVVSEKVVIESLKPKGVVTKDWKGYNQLKRDSQKLKKIFPDKFMIYNLVNNIETIDTGERCYDVYYHQLENAAFKARISGQRNALALNFRKVPGVKGRPYLDTDEFWRFIDIIKPYTPLGVRHAAASASDDQIRYFNYLTSGRKLNAEDEYRLDVLQGWLIGNISEEIDKYNGPEVKPPDTTPLNERPQDDPQRILQEKYNININDINELNKVKRLIDQIKPKQPRGRLRVHPAPPERQHEIDAEIAAAEAAEQAKVKRGPGRPKGSKNKRTLEMERLEAEAAEKKQGRGRPAGSKNKKRGTKHEQQIERTETKSNKPL